MITIILLLAITPGILSRPALWQDLTSLGNYIKEDFLQQIDYGRNITHFFVDVGQDIYRLENLKSNDITTSITPDDVTYYFYSNEQPYNAIVVKHDDVRQLENSNFKADRRTMLIVHGWRNSYESEINSLIKDAAVFNHAVNVFIVDWSPVASRNYVSAKWSVTKMGSFLALFLQSLVETFGLDLRSVTIVGHSLGAHVAGNAGAALGGGVGHIVGLDPAWPLFSIQETQDRLDENDAMFVEVIHTNGQLLGFFRPIGHVDYYPNGGRIQVGCGLDITGICSHSRSYKYYAESLMDTDAFVAKWCTSYDDYSMGNCRFGPSRFMGGYGINKSSRGKYYLDTRETSPFAKDAGYL